MRSSQASIDERYDKALEEASQPTADLKTVEALLIAAHEAGDARATYALATWHLHGKVFSKNTGRGLELLKIAAKHGVADALFDLAVCYETGEFVRKSTRKAAELYLRAALLGEKQSIYEIGRCYFYGIGVALDKIIARVWLDRAAELGLD